MCEGNPADKCLHFRPEVLDTPYEYATTAAKHCGTAAELLELRGLAEDPLWCKKYAFIMVVRIVLGEVVTDKTSAVQTQAYQVCINFCICAMPSQVGHFMIGLLDDAWLLASRNNMRRIAFHHVSWSLILSTPRTECLTN